MIYAYIRVSTRHQNIDRQYEEIKALDIDDRHIYIDKESGKDFDRTKYQKLIKKLKKDDLLIVKSIDRLFLVSLIVFDNSFFQNLYLIDNQ